ncbi:MAG: low-specificity L-threonine aldolase [Ktedonobacteraceae bacterium]|nr:low-specificity L-threonine aldolase [Ktedonobacteraceae bacterium]
MLIDLRSDTVTLPTPAMRRAMYEAEVGDDVYGEDPTINRLQDLAAARTGKEAALFVPSGTMGNLTAIMTHAGRGRAVIVGDQSHTYQFEAGGASTLGGCPFYVVPNDAGGMLDLEKVRAGIADESNAHIAATALICIENTHNLCGGTVLSVEQIEQITSLAHAHGLPVHMDGARIFNASVALGVPVSTLARSVDSLMFCLSKGLSAPVGSLLVGSREFIQRAHRIRKVLGGGMRQAGILATAGIVALEEMVERLAEDHENCKRLAYGLADFPQITIAPERVQTNILIFTLRDAAQQPLDEARTQRFLIKAREHGVLLGSMGGGKIRAVTHYGIEARHIAEALVALRHALEELVLGAT